MIKKILTIAGSDAGGGAGIQADLKTFEEYGTFGLSSITSILTVDPGTQLPDIFPIPIDVLEKQVQTAFSGGPVDAVKIGLLGSIEVIDVIEKFLKMNKQPHVVLDPVMAVKVNDNVLQPELVEAMIKRLVPLADIVTPNLVEARILANMEVIETKEQLKEAAKKIYDLGPQSVVIKGGTRFPGERASDLFYDGESFEFIHEEKIETKTNHGAGCSFAAAITAGLGKGLSTFEAVQLAKNYVTSSIQNGLYLNSFTGYVWHGAYLNAEERMTKGEGNNENK
ncbi:bifunctional hydroxymethylpyrimidine kinase/phosphomethylpyrimidine kinase [Vagococcus carniphilus]|uniref:bifunctional hydroxymethylpyrimidine kinase/phosphomethylpyrimidine kinase n=1 Tax=Vagococcus carniphilus TaxID=218144 RepID=UPI00288CBE00|nr:bifunctional hydroxymethylpyrimidine kinase/phosphomethylpyrimidine kinase [Vagococcus carniphilus]MDT2829300.1 bifunctional hydroxymethylpyrimidine kinase/phosphomethylpyrimidine kinase [Vagococcus carniphilus]MDT2852817.1 bifunctional hydroxymethylpyrimidine kinase/phosphomethylpyrimidine kinase [Vagococcus carniphilus]